MMSLLLLAAAVACASAASIDKCAAGEWSAWSECVSSKHCPAVPLTVQSYPMESTTAWDTGRTQMERIMKLKVESRKARASCIAEGTCPEVLKRPDAGQHSCVLGFAGEHPCKNVDQLSFLNFVQMGYDPPLPGDRTPEGNDVWGWTDPFNGDEYAIMGFTGGTAFVRVTDPINPVPVGFMYSATTSAIWRDIKVIGDYAYIVSEAPRHGLQVFDMRHLRGLTSLNYFEPDAINQDFGNAHNLVSNEDTNFLYVVGATMKVGYPRVCDGGLLILDVSDPLQPTFVSCFGEDGYVHDAQCVIYHGPDVRYQQREVCFCFNEDSLTIVDVNDKSNMNIIAKTGYINAAYTHQGWTTEDHELILLDDELDEYELDSASQYTKTYAWDVRDLQNPVLKSVFQSSERSIDHNQYIIGDLSYQANYESGLRILHINRATYQLTNVGYFDVFPSRTEADFYGSWSVYPYFKSGNVLVSSIDYGLFVVRPNIAAINALIESGTTYAEQQRSRPAIAARSGAICPKIMETRSCSAPVLC